MAHNPATSSSELYPALHHIHDLDNATLEDLRQIIRTYPVIDNHAHNILTEDNAYGSADHPFEGITSEAQSHALMDHVHTSLAHIRGMKQLGDLYQCPGTLQDVKACRYEWIRRDYPSLVKRCFQGTHSILMDDGLSPQVVYPYKWHRQLVPTVYRIVRIEAVATELLEQLAIAAGFLKVGLDADWPISQTESFLVRFNTVFRNHIRTLANDPDVRGFKSVICYRSGLDVALDSRKNFRPHQSLTGSNLLTAFHEFMQGAVRDHNYRIQRKEVNDFLVVVVCDVLDKLVDTDGESLPFQFHTGLGDSDIDLVKANPAYMQPLIEAFPHVDFVILHSSYPYTREAGYLASTYSNAWLDIGEVFPMLSRDGQESMLRQSLELAPTSKILWSTDGHFYPETYWLANTQFRLVLEKVLSNYVEEGDISVPQAVHMAVDIMFWNSNTLYKLDEERKAPELMRALGQVDRGSVRTIVNGSSKPASYMSYASTAVESTPNGSATNRANASSRPETSTPLQQGSRAARPSRSVQQALDTTVTSQEDDVAAFTAFLESNPSVKYIWLQLCDYTGMVRIRMVPVQQVRKQLATGKLSYNTTALTRVMQDDHPATGMVPVGQFLMRLDVSSLSVNMGLSGPVPPTSASVATWWMEDTLEIPARQHWDRCPRWLLQKQANALKSDFNIDMLLGFEVEMVFTRPQRAPNSRDFIDFEPLHSAHSWLSMTNDDLDLLPMVEEIVDALTSIGIDLVQFHSESATGQWEFPLPAAEPVKAVDMLYKAKDVIRFIAKAHGYKATAYPRPYATTAGTAQHAHFSINGPGVVEQYADSFLAGVLEHLPSIAAFSLPLEESYQRVQPGVWGGGVWVCWGYQNKEVPIRGISPGHWELKTIDGIGNAYLSMAALLAAGYAGVSEELLLEHTDCTIDPSTGSDEQRAQFGITSKLPSSLKESLAALEKNEVLREALGNTTLEDYLALKRSEMDKLNAMAEQDRRVWLMSRY
jgi:glutamine synthetase